MEFILNGKQVSTDRQGRLMEYLRTAAGLTSVKNGCSSGVCGSCTVLVNGEPKRSCRLDMKSVEGCSVLTTEGLTPYEKKLYTYSFGAAGAVQCGFCTPGMVLVAKSLLSKNPAPSEQEIRRAFRANLCRCTGYQKIIQAVRIAGDILKSGREIPGQEEEKPDLGAAVRRCDVEEKVCGSAVYTDDIALPGMLYVRAVRPPRPRCRLRSIDISEARTAPGVVDIVTAADIPGAVYDGYIIPDWPVMVPVGDCTRMAGDTIAAVAAESEAQAAEAAKLIRVDYEELEPVLSPAQALEPEAPALHEGGNILADFHFERGAVEKTLAGADLVIRRTFTTPWTEHAFLEPESAVAYFDESGVLTVVSASQDIYHSRKSLAHILNMEEERIRVRSVNVGGGFGGKEDLTCQHIAALVCLRTKRPVKFTFTRQESLAFHPKRHPMEITLTLAADKGGNFLAVQADVTADTGAYASLGAGVMRRACTHAAGPYRISNFRVDGRAVYTNNPPAGAFRGFGVPQVAFAMESMVDILAGRLGRDRWELRYQNALRPGDVMPMGQLCGPDTAMPEVLEQVRAAYQEASTRGAAVGLACGYKSAGIGNGREDIGRVDLEVRNGKVLLYTSAQCIGQGLKTAMTQIAAYFSGLELALFQVQDPDTDSSPNSGPTTASRQTHITGQAARSAAEQLRQALEGHTLRDLEGRRFSGVFQDETDPVTTIGGRTHSAYSYAANVVILDKEGRLEKVVAAHDVGVPVNRLNVEGQIEGGVVMGLGYALTEDLRLEKGVVKSQFGTLGLLRFTDIPPIESIIVDQKLPWEVCGPKGIGEISTIPTAAAVACAYYARDHQERLSLPLEETPYSRKK